MKFFGQLLHCSLVVLSVLSGASPASAEASPRTLEGIVLRISEGDCITVNSNGRSIKVRLYGIDAPETEKKDSVNGGVKRGQAFGDAAFRALAHKVLHRNVRLDVIGTDRHNQEVCVVWIENRNINLEMIAEGWAWCNPGQMAMADDPVYLEAEKQARARKLGLWAQSNPQPPWEFRKLLKRGRLQEK